MSKRIRILLILLVVGGLGALLVVGALALKGDQDAAVTAYGTDAIALCKTTMNTAVAGDAPQAGRFAFIDATLFTVYREYQDKVNPSNAASSKAELIHLACLTQMDRLYDTDSYGAAGKFTCTRYAKDMAVALFEVASGKQIGYWVVPGGVPESCPQTTSKSLTKYGNPPVAADVLSTLGLN